MVLEFINICKSCKMRIQLLQPQFTNAFVHSRAFASSITSMKNHGLEERPVENYIGKHHKKAKRIYMWGNTRTGALGIAKFLVPDEYKRPVLTQSKPYNFHWAVRASLNVKQIAAGFGFSLLGAEARGNISIFGCGINTDSQLGFHSQKGNPLDYIISPQPIELPLSHLEDVTITDVACGRGHSVVATDKAVFTFGNNAFGQCGRSIVEDEVYHGSRTIHTIEREDIVKVVCGYDHTLMLSKDGNVYSCGLGTDGQTGQGDFECTVQLTRVKGDIDGVKIADISCRCDTVLAVSEEGELFGWGNSEYGQFDMVTSDPQINQPTHLPVFSTCGKIKSVAAAGTNCALVNEDGEVYVWGYGILGKGPDLQQCNEPQPIPMPFFGNNTFSKDVVVERVFSGVNYLAALTNTKALYTWGKNSNGCLGLGHRNDQFFPFLVSIGSEVNDMACGADHVITLCRAFV